VSSPLSGGAQPGIAPHVVPPAVSSPLSGGAQPGIALNVVPPAGSSPLSGGAQPGIAPLVVPPAGSSPQSGGAQPGIAPLVVPPAGSSPLSGGAQPGIAPHVVPPAPLTEQQPLPAGQWFSTPSAHLFRKPPTNPALAEPSSPEWRPVSGKATFPANLVFEDDDDDDDDDDDLPDLADDNSSDDGSDADLPNAIRRPVSGSTYVLRQPMIHPGGQYTLVGHTHEEVDAYFGNLSLMVPDYTTYFLPEVGVEAEPVPCLISTCPPPPPPPNGGAMTVSGSQSPEIVVLASSGPRAVPREFRVEDYMMVHVAGDGHCAVSSVQVLSSGLPNIEPCSRQEMKKRCVHLVLQQIFMGQERVKLRVITHAETFTGMKVLRLECLRVSPVTEVANIAQSEDLNRLVSVEQLEAHLKCTYLKPKDFIDR